MSTESEHNDDPGMSLSFDVPASDPNLFKHSATNDVLFFLTNHHFMAYSISGIANRLDVSKTSVSQVVGVLAANDLVDVEHEGPAKFVSINRDRLDVPDNPVLRISQQEYHEPVRHAIETIRRDVDNLAGIVLYGSVARGEADRQSDIDLWVLVTDDRMYAQRTINELVQELEDETFNDPPQRYDFHVDVEQTGSLVQYAEDINRIINTGIPLYTTDVYDKAENIINNIIKNNEHE